MAALDPRWKGKWKMPVTHHGVPTFWGWVVYYPNNFKLGYGVDIGFGSFIQAEEGVEIGEHTQIGSLCSIYSVDTISARRGRVIIGARAKIGSHSVIMPGITIGEGAVCGAFSYIDKNVPPYVKRVNRVSVRVESAIRSGI